MSDKHIYQNTSSIVEAHTQHIIYLEQRATLEERILLYAIQLHFYKVYATYYHINMPLPYHPLPNILKKVISKTFTKEEVYNRTQTSLLYIYNLHQEEIKEQCTLFITDIYT